MDLNQDIILLAHDQQQFGIKLQTWLDGCQKLIADYWERSKYTYAPHEVLSTSEGPKFIKVWAHDRQWIDSSDHSKGIAPVGRPSRIYAFINKETGDILKPASTKIPAKHARGNLFDEHNGLKYMNNHGPCYLR